MYAPFSTVVYSASLLWRSELAGAPRPRPRPGARWPSTRAIRSRLRGRPSRRALRGGPGRGGRLRRARRWIARLREADAAGRAPSGPVTPAVAAAMPRSRPGATTRRSRGSRRCSTALFGWAGAGPSAICSSTRCWRPTCARGAPPMRARPGPPGRSPAVGAGGRGVVTPGREYRPLGDRDGRVLPRRHRDRRPRGAAVLPAGHDPHRERRRPRPLPGRAKLVRSGRHALRGPAPSPHPGGHGPPGGGAPLRGRLSRAARSAYARGRARPALLPRARRAVPGALRPRGAPAARSIPLDTGEGLALLVSGARHPVRAAAAISSVHRVEERP
jgi:hypothetical protein